MKQIKYHNATITIERMHMYGHYIINGLGTSAMTTDADIWDNIDNDENPEKAKDARRQAYQLLQSNK